MDLKEYIKNINAYLLMEESEEGTSETVADTVTQLEELKSRFEAFLVELEKAGLTLEDVQNAAGEQQPASPPQPSEAPAETPAEPAPAAEPVSPTTN